MMKRYFGILLVAAAAMLAPTDVQSQTRGDTAAVLLKAARDFQVEGRHDAARAVLDLIRRKYGDTPAAGSVPDLLSSYANRVQADGSGRVELLVWGTTYGLWLGVATPIIADADGPEAFGVGLLAGAPAGFLLARKYANDHPGLTEGQARAITFGGTWGTWQGYGWMDVLGGETINCGDLCGEYRTDPSTSASVASMVAGGVAGIGTGLLLARKPIPSGVAAAVSSSGLWGTWFGFATGVITDLEDRDRLAATLLGGDAMVVAAGLLAPKWSPSVNRVRLVSLSGLVGGVAGGGLVLIMQPDDEDVGVGIPLATSIIGLVTGAHLTREYDRDRAVESSGGEAGNSLLRYSEGRWDLGSAAPVPVLRRDDRGPRPRLQPALAMNLFSARF